MFLFGSRAAKIWFSDFREPNDYDFIGTYDDFEKMKNHFSTFYRNCEFIDISPMKSKIIAGRGKEKIRIEFEIAERDSARTMLDIPIYDDTKIVRLFGMLSSVASPTLLWLTKRSHVYWKIHWEKSIEDLHWIKSRCTTEPTETEWYFYRHRLNELQNRFDQYLEHDISGYDIGEFKKKLLIMTEKKFGSITKENFIKVLKEVATSREYGASSEAVIQFYPNLIAEID